MAWPGSCAVEGATARSGRGPAAADALARRLPEQRADDAQPRRPVGAGTRAAGGSPRASARASRMEPSGSGPGPSRARQSVYSRRPCSTTATRRSNARHASAPSGVRGGRTQRIGREPGRRPRCTCGISVDPDTARLRDERRRRGEDVRDRDRPRLRRRRDRRPRRAHGGLERLSGRSRVGNTWYSGAAANTIPAAVAGASSARHVCSSTVSPARPAPRRARASGTVPDTEEPRRWRRGRAAADVRHDRQRQLGEPAVQHHRGASGRLVETPRGRLARRPQLRPRGCSSPRIAASASASSPAATPSRGGQDAREAPRETCARPRIGSTVSTPSRAVGPPGGAGSIRCTNSPGWSNKADDAAGRLDGDRVHHDRRL